MALTTLTTRETPTPPHFPGKRPNTFTTLQVSATQNALATVKYVNIALIKGLWNRKMPRKGYDPEPVLIGERAGGEERERGCGCGRVTATTGVSPA